MMNRHCWIRRFLFSSLVLSAMCLNMGGCPGNSTSPPGDDSLNDNGSTDDPSNNDNGSSDDDQTNEDQNGEGSDLFVGISGNETLVEGEDTELGDGSTETRDERFTSTFTLTRLDAEFCGQVFVGDILADKTCGNLQGQAHLTYSESGSSFSPDSDCPTDEYSGQVEWNVDLEGTYTVLPTIDANGEVVFDSITIDISTATVSSPEYSVSFTNPGCPEFDSVSPSNYFWAGPGQGTFTLEPIVIINGLYDGRYENPFGNDLGDADYYEINAGTTDEP